MQLPPFIEREFPYKRGEVNTSWGKMGYALSGRRQPVLLLHGNPTWGFLYRKVMALLENDRCQCVAPDLIGLGTSSKPQKLAEHSLKRHGESLTEFVEALKLKDIVLVVQDWGGPIGLWMTHQLPQNVSALLMMNTSVLKPRSFRTTPFHRFSHLPLLSNFIFEWLMFPVPVMPLVQGKKSSLSLSTLRAYAWPLRKKRDRIAPLALARMVPNSAEHPTTKELDKSDRAFRTFQGKVAFVWGRRDPILGRALKKHHALFPESSVTETQAGHFLQEEVPEVIAESIRGLLG